MAVYKNWTVEEYRALKDHTKDGPWALENRGPRDQGGSGKYYANRGQKILGICLHITAGIQDYTPPDGSAESTTRYGQTTNNDASWSMIVDSDSIIPSLQEHRVGWVQGVPGFNFNRPLYGIEIGKRTPNWGDAPQRWTDDILRRLAVVCAPRVIAYNIPLRRVSDRYEVQRLISQGRPVGFTYHSDLTPSTRSDPGLYRGSQTFPLERFFVFLREEIALRKGTTPSPTPEPSFPKGTYEVFNIKDNDPDGGLVRREGPGTSYPVYGEQHLENGMLWHATGKVQNGWSEGQSDWQKENGVAPKWVHTAWLRPVKTEKPKTEVWEVTANVLNARSGPGTNHKIVGTAPRGTRITATGKSSGKWLEGQTPWQRKHKTSAWYHTDHLKLSSGSSTPPPAPPKPPMAVLRRGSKGKAVGILQRGLNATFPAYSKLTVDNSFGPATEKVVKEFQRRSKLTADGIVGVKTQQALLKFGIKW